MAELEGKMFLTNIPEDIKKISRKKLFTRIFILCTIYVIEIVIAVVFRDMFFKRGINSAVINTAAMLFVPWLFIMIPLKKDRSWVGKIRKCKVITKTSFQAPGVLKSDNGYYDAENRIVLDLINGCDVFSKDINSFNVSGESKLNNYKKDRIAIHIFGTKYTTAIPENEDDKTICAVCGEENECSDTHCKDCGHSLLNKSNVR